MRYFKLENAAAIPVTFDITTEEYFFHDISGLGFEEDNDFRRVGPLWRLESSVYRQKPITGKLCFTDRGSTTPYEKYAKFVDFVASDPLYICYWPHGLTGKMYRKRVRVSVLEKNELNTYGVLDDRIEFAPYTDWYESVSAENEMPDGTGTDKWIWDSGAVWRDSLDEPIPEGMARYVFGLEFRGDVTLMCDKNIRGLVKLTIHGPAVNPSWLHYVNGVLVATGGIDVGSDLTLTEDETLIVDSTTDSHSMTVFNSSDRSTRNVYPIRDFDKKCFLELRGGKNTIVVSSADGVPVKIEVEGQLYHATV